MMKVVNVHDEGRQGRKSVATVGLIQHVDVQSQLEIYSQWPVWRISRDVNVCFVHNRTRSRIVEAVCPLDPPVKTYLS